MKRDNIDRDYAEIKLLSQATLADKIKKCEELQIAYSTIDNSETLEKTYQLVNKVLETI
jgi:dephospho-CoA kinase